MSLLLHITTPQAWEEAQAQGEYKAPSLESEGFIHCSAIEQLVETANIHFKGQSALVVLVVDPTLVTAPIRYEEPAGSNRSTNLRFPHVYGPIPSQAVVECVELPVDNDGRFHMPALSHLFPLQG
ncbi:MAG: DUF952 domain-containing protein [Deltaproteobacteria bacterium]|nr:MAG: DUF952 domain-containing protein [Deltaproteobacteria bacterium]